MRLFTCVFVKRNNLPPLWSRVSVSLSLQRLHPRLPVFMAVCHRLLEAAHDVIQDLRTFRPDPQGRSVGLAVEHERVLEQGQGLLRDSGRVLGPLKRDLPEDDAPWTMISILAVQTLCPVC